MSIIVTSNDCKKNSSRLGKITPDDFNYKTCLVCVPNVSYRCEVGKFSKKAGFAKFCFAATLTGTGYTKYQVHRLNVACIRQLATFNINVTELLNHSVADHMGSAESCPQTSPSPGDITNSSPAVLIEVSDQPVPFYIRMWHHDIPSKTTSITIHIKYASDTE